MMDAIGIEKLSVYPTSLSLDLAALCAARNHDPADVRDNLMIDRRAVNPPWEDTVTMAVNAATMLLTAEDRDAIELLIVGTETSVDQEKPVSSWAHRFLGLSSRCRNFELKHACYSGTAALQMAAAWLAACGAPNSKALVLTADQSLIALGQPYEFVCGAGACAVLLSRHPDFIAIELGNSGIYAHEVSDVMRPTPRIETGNSEMSLYAYLEALDGACAAYEARVGVVDFKSWFAANIYHVPFGGMTLRAHRALLERSSAGRAWSRSEVRAHWARRTEPSLRYTRQMGATYGSSLFVALLGLLDGTSDLRAGDRIGIFSYGSGSCAELYSVRVGPRATQVAAASRLPALLDARRAVSVPEYEIIERERDAHIGARHYDPHLGVLAGWYDKHYRDRHTLVLCGIEDYVRHYDWS